MKHNSMNDFVELLGTTLGYIVMAYLGVVTTAATMLICAIDWAIEKGKDIWNKFVK